ncbi:MAG: leucine-rich repeat protein [Clostridia bacterium]|nr:leucine-rich repeat protein [Clostridia bacterium]
MKKIIWIGISIVLLSALFVIGVFADASGEMYTLYEGGVIVNNTWEYKESEKTLYIRSNTYGNYNETGRISYDTENNAWGAYIEEIEHIVLEGTFDKCSREAFKDHTALKDIRISSVTTQFDGSCFEGCTNLESVTVGNAEHVKGYADLSNANVLRGDNHFLGTKITTAFFLNDVSIPTSTATSHFNEGTTLYLPGDTNVYEYFEGTGRYTVIDNSPVEVRIKIEGETYTELYPYGTEITLPTIGESCVALYKDAECTEPYKRFTATEDISLYGKPLLKNVGAMVRIEDYHGLRMIYKVDENTLSADFGYEIKEFGALSMEQGSIGKELKIGTEEYRTVVYTDGKYVGSLLSIPTGGIIEYAYTAVGFEENGVINVSNAEQNLYFRGYIILKDSVSGEEITCYTEQKKMNLADACYKTLKANEENGGTMLKADAVKFIEVPLDCGAAPHYIYTKEELISAINTIYNDPDHYMPAQHLGTSPTALSDFLDRAYEETGAYPALVAFDLSELTAYNSKAISIIKECKEYISRGGIVSFSYHMENPTGNYTSEGLCRGELGGEDKWIELMTDGTELNKRFNEILDYAGVFLNEFDREGYPVIWRPLHENNGSWFWWCAIQTFEENGTEVTRAIDQEIFINLWKYVYEYYTDVWGFKHLVWAYSPNVTNSNSPMPVMYGYPGDEYCDIAGTDWYTSGDFEVNGDSQCYKTLMVETKKPAALTEFGPSGSLRADASLGQIQIDIFSCREQLDLIKRMLDEGLKLTYVLNWSGSWSMLSLGNMNVLMADESALDLSEVKEIFDIEFEKRN